MTGHPTFDAPARAARWHAGVAWAAALTVLALALGGCATGKDAVVTGATFSFVAPGGQTVITYDPPASRGTVNGLSGDNLLQPGHPITLNDFPGQVVVLNIWGSWCGPCWAETPDLEQTYQATKAAGVTLLGIDVRDDRDAAADFVRNHGVTYPSIFDPPGRALFALHGFPRNTVPATIVLDRDHRVAAIFLTRIRISQLLPVVRRIAAEPANPGPPP
ncbi:MAG: TlpA family protein disulfide reductase [Actinomycetota bacterium]|nr:TlpA family protein disulfide reductase [Actinomycetota bacterium]